MSFPLRPILYVFLVLERPEKWSCGRRVAWKMGGSKFTWPLWAGGRWCCQSPSYGQVSTKKAPAKAYCKISMGWREGMGKSWGKNAGGQDLGNSAFYLELRPSSVLAYVLGGIQDRGWEKEQNTDDTGFSPTSHMQSSASFHIQEKTTGPFSHFLPSNVSLLMFYYTTFLFLLSAASPTHSRFSPLLCCYTSILSFLKSCL